MTLHQAFDTLSTLDLNYTFTATASTLKYFYASTGAFFNSLTPAQAGSQFPNTDFTYHMLEANLRWQYSSAVAVRFYYPPWIIRICPDYRTIPGLPPGRSAKAIPIWAWCRKIIPPRRSAVLLQYTF